MKIKILFAGILLISAAAFASAQSVSITPRKGTFVRPKPISEYKKTFTVTRPIVKAANLALSKKIADAVSFERAFGLNIKEEMDEVQWLEEADFEVLYNKDSILTIRLWVSGSGAYPSGSEKTIVVDTSTGNVLKAADLFRDLKQLFAVVQARQAAEAAAAIVEIKADPENADIKPAEFFGERSYTPADLDSFEVEEKGVTFIYDYGFPHVVKALEPEGKYMMTWAELQPFIKRGGLLGRFIS